MHKTKRKFRLIKIAGYFIIAVILTAAASVSAFAYTVSFTVFDSKEEKYIYEDVGTNNANGSRFCDASSYIIYEFPIQETDKYVSLTWVIQNQYAVYVCTTNPDDIYAWKPIYFNVKPADAENPDWSTPASQMHKVTHDLSKYAVECKDRKIWIIMGDSDPDGGWGGFISDSEPVVFKTSQTEPVVGAADEYVPPVTEQPVEPEAPSNNGPTDAETGAGSGSKINVERYKQPVLGIVGGAAALTVFLAVFFIKRSLWSK